MLKSVLKYLTAALLSLSAQAANDIVLGIPSSITWQGSSPDWVGSWGSAEAGPQPFVWYRLEETSDTSYEVADSIGTATGYAVDLPSNMTTAGQVGNAFLFGTMNLSSFQAPSGVADFDGATPFSVTFWAKWKVDWDNPFLFGTGSANKHDSKGWCAHLYAGGIYFTLNAGTYYQENEIQSRSGTALFTDTVDENWAFVCVAYDGSRTATGVKFYINGSLDNSYYGADTDNLTQSIKSDGPLLVGNNSQGSSQFYGTLDEIKIFDFELNALQAQDVFAGRPLSPTTTTPFQWVTIYFDPFSTYPGDAQADGVYVDYSSAQYNASLNTFYPYPQVHTSGPYMSEGWRSGTELYYEWGPLPPDGFPVVAAWYYQEQAPTVTITFDATSLFPGDPGSVYIDYTSVQLTPGTTFYEALNYNTYPNTGDYNGQYYFNCWRDENYTYYYDVYTDVVPASSTTLYAEWY